MREGRWVALRLKDVWVTKVNFYKGEFLNTKLEGLDLSDCDIQEIAVSPNDIAGVIVNEEQALMLVSLLGIIIH